MERPRRPTLVWLLAAFAAARVAVYALAFPFFNAVDEHQHVDAVVRYARGEWPGARMVGLDPRVALWALEFGSFEYLEPGPDVPAPYLRRPGASLSDPVVRAAHRAFVDVPDTEHDSPPAYYAIAGLWFAIGDAAGLDGRALLVWLRLLNALALAGLVAAACFSLRRLAPDRPLLHWGVPALLAAHPQDCFFGVTADGFAAVTGGLAFLALAAIAHAPPDARPARFAAAGLAVAAAFLTKLTSVAWVVAALPALVLWWRRAHGAPARARVARLAAWAVAAAAPVALWCLRNRWVIGDWSGTARKVAHLEWTPRAWSAVFDHPIWTPAGLVEFAGGLLPRLWRGEFTWHGSEMAWPALDATYVVATLALPGLVAWRWLRSPARRASRAGDADLVALVALASGIAVLALLSTRFEFASWGTPTRDHPFFIHGRLIAGVIAPLCWLFVRGLEVVTRPLAAAHRDRVAWALLAVWIAGVTLCEAVLNAPAFASPWNAFAAG